MNLEKSKVRDRMDMLNLRIENARILSDCLKSEKIKWE
jgi:hypothetical protein